MSSNECLDLWKASLNETGGPTTPLSRLLQRLAENCGAGAGGVGPEGPPGLPGTPGAQGIPGPPGAGSAGLSAVLFVDPAAPGLGTRSTVGLELANRFPTVQDAVNAAQGGDQIVLAPAHYNETVVVPPNLVVSVVGLSLDPDLILTPATSPDLPSVQAFDIGAGASVVIDRVFIGTNVAPAITVGASAFCGLLRCWMNVSDIVLGAGATLVCTDTDSDATGTITTGATGLVRLIRCTMRGTAFNVEGAVLNLSDSDVGNITLGAVSGNGSLFGDDESIVTSITVPAGANIGVTYSGTIRPNAGGGISVNSTSVLALIFDRLKRPGDEAILFFTTFPGPGLRQPVRMRSAALISATAGSIGVLDFVDLDLRGSAFKTTDLASAGSGAIDRDRYEFMVGLLAAGPNTINIPPPIFPTGTVEYTVVVNDQSAAPVVIGISGQTDVSFVATVVAPGTAGPVRFRIERDY